MSICKVIQAALFMMPALSAYGADIGSNQGIMWGINGHPAQGGSYARNLAEKQLGDVSAVGLKSYRVDVYDASPTFITGLRHYVEVGRTYGVKILPVLIPDFLSYADEAAAEAGGFMLGKTYASAFAADVQVWGIGNEYEGYVGSAVPNSDAEGSNLAQYNQVKYALARGSLRGMLNGIHAGNPRSKGIVNTAGGCRYGFLTALWDDGVRWDITGEHWYSGAGNILELHCKAGAMNKLAFLKDTFGKPIWITEFNWNQNSNKASMAGWLTTTMRQWSVVSSRYGLEAAFIYELYDQPELSGMEAGFGIADANGTLNASGSAVAHYLAKHPSVVY
jgi:hypothetical protein